MTTAIAGSEVGQALEASGNSWVFAFWGSDADRMLQKFAMDVQEFIGEYERRFGERPDPLGLLRADPMLGKAFFDIDTLEASLEMKIMIWRILHGCEIARVEFVYETGRRSLISITIRSLGGETDPPYVGSRAWDYRVLRHFLGSYDQNGQLVLSGYYAKKA